ncbi:MAG TPA: AraC family transcriptional regulator, partial [Bacteroidia bacterium]|nr:AraC family transcriptional regulator [Bacteroidia bacterium]
MKIYIKYMVSIRCKLFVMDVIKRMGLKLIKVELGFVEFEG